MKSPLDKLRLRWTLFFLLDLLPSKDYVYSFVPVLSFDKSSVLSDRTTGNLVPNPPQFFRVNRGGPNNKSEDPPVIVVINSPLGTSFCSTFLDPDLSFFILLKAIRTQLKLYGHPVIEESESSTSFYVDLL